MHSPADGTAAPDPRSAARWQALDLLRGLAVVAMVAFHTSWDLDELKLLDLDVSGALGWQLFARAIASTFLAVSGVALALAHGDRLRPAAFVRRLALVTGAALAVTVATFFVFPASYIFFGILHNIALSSVLALPFLRAPALLTLLAGAAILSAPAVVGGPSFDAPLLSFLGLGHRIPLTNDYVPVFPWSGFVLVGVGVGRAIRGWVARSAAAPSGRAALQTALAFLGRHSLAIYLLHQPIIFGLLWGIAQAVGPNPSAEVGQFLRFCERSCVAAGQQSAICKPRCSCTLDGLRRETLWPAIARHQASPDDIPRAAAVGQTCFDENR